MTCFCLGPPADRSKINGLACVHGNSAEAIASRKGGGGAMRWLRRLIQDRRAGPGGPLGTGRFPYFRNKSFKASMDRACAVVSRSSAIWCRAFSPSGFNRVRRPL
jgi:hypothetical protein